MDCYKKHEKPQVKDCMQCEFEGICKKESIFRSANEISNIHTENVKGLVSRVDDMDSNAEQKIGPLWNIVRALIFATIMATVCLLLGYMCDGHV